MTQDELFMKRAIALARCGEAGAAPNPMVGAVVVCNGRIIGEGFHRKYGGPHAEVNAIASVRERDLLPESTIYVTLEPCSHWGKTPPCCDLIIENRLKRVVVGMRDPNAKVNGKGLKRIQEAGIEVCTGVLEQECRDLNPVFLTFHEKKRPYITLKWAQTNDGFIGLRGCGGLRISTDFGAMLVHRLRTRCQAIMVGTETALNDNPSLTARRWKGNSPLRVTIDRHNRLPMKLNLLNDGNDTVVYHSEILSEILYDLHKCGIQHLVVEGGCKLLQSFIDRGLWDVARVETGSRELREICQSASHADLENSGTPVHAPILKNAKLHKELEVGGNKVLILFNSSSTN